MKKLLLYFTFIIVCFQNVTFSENKISLKEGNDNAKIKMIIFESMTCSHCGDFHRDVYPELKSKYIDKGIVKIEYKNFPLDLAALNASKIVHCKKGGGINVLHMLYQNQKDWVKGTNILELNSNLKNLLIKKNININFEECINDKEIEDFILEERITGSTKYQIKSTPTLIINGDKFEKSLNFKNLDKKIKKML